MTDRKSDRTYWTTDSEISYIRNMGRYYPVECSRATLLQRYKQASLNRVDWAGMDRGRIMQALDRELMAYGG